MPKISLDMPNELLTDIKQHVGDNKKFISVADAIRSACRKLLDNWIALTCDMGVLEEKTMVTRNEAQDAVYTLSLIHI